MSCKNHIIFFINEQQVIFEESTVDAETAEQLKTNDDFALSYIKELIRLKLVDIEELHTVIRLDPDGNTILYEADKNKEQEMCPLGSEDNTSSNIRENRDDSQGWTDEETRLILDKYEKYLSLVGPMKKFKNKKSMWIQISQDLLKQFQIARNAQQIENRYKTILKRKKKSTDENQRTGNTRHQIPFERELQKIAAIDDSIEPHVLRGVNIVKKNNEKIKEIAAPLKSKGENKSTVNILRQTLLEIHERKEEGRERRHKEKMEILMDLVKKINKTD